MRRWMAVLACLALVAGACGGDDGTATPATTATTAAEEPAGGAADFTVVGKEYSFDVPAEVEGGVVTMEFTNEGKLKHEAQILGIGDQTPEQALKDFTPVIQGEGAPIPAYLGAHGGVLETDAGASGTSTFTLPVGNYLVVCTLTDLDSAEEGGEEGGEEFKLPLHFNVGMAAPLKVTKVNDKQLPAADGTIVAKDYSFEVPALSAGKQTLVFKNEGPKEIHFAEFLEFPEGVDAAGALKAFEALLTLEEGSPPPEGTPLPSEEFEGASAVFNPGQGGTFEVELKAKRSYVVACFISDRAGGPPHAIGQKMITSFTVEQRAGEALGSLAGPGR